MPGWPMAPTMSSPARPPGIILARSRALGDVDRQVAGPAPSRRSASPAPRSSPATTSGIASARSTRPPLVIHGTADAAIPTRARGTARRRPSERRAAGRGGRRYARHQPHPPGRGERGDRGLPEVVARLTTRFPPRPPARGSIEAWLLNSATGSPGTLPYDEPGLPTWSGVRSDGCNGPPSLAVPPTKAKIGRHPGAEPVRGPGPATCWRSSPTTRGGHRRHGAPPGGAGRDQRRPSRGAR